MAISPTGHRHVRENMSGEELVILDILTSPPELTTEERNEIKNRVRSKSRAVERALEGVCEWHFGASGHVSRLLYREQSNQRRAQDTNSENEWF